MTFLEYGLQGKRTMTIEEKCFSFDDMTKLCIQFYPLNVVVESQKTGKFMRFINIDIMTHF